MIQLGIAIPCYKYHLPKLKRCLDSIMNQTEKPDLVVVSCSSSETSHIPDFPVYTFPFKMIIFSEFRNASQNRNTASDYLRSNGMTHISFFDADDEMHPQRIEFIKKAFLKQPDSELVIHSFWRGLQNNEEFKMFDSVPIAENVLVRGKKSQSGVFYSHNKSFELHHSQISVPITTLERVKFPEEKEYERKEDSFFCQTLLKDDTKNSVILLPLSKYHEEGVWY